MDFIEENWKWLFGIVIFFLISFILTLMSQNAELKEYNQSETNLQELRTDIFNDCVSRNPNNLKVCRPINR